MSPVVVAVQSLYLLLVSVCSARYIDCLVAVVAQEVKRTSSYQKLGRSSASYISLDKTLNPKLPLISVCVLMLEMTLATIVCL